MPIHLSLLPRQFFQPSCPSGGIFYACTSGTNFVGCCTSTSACASGCSDGSLQPASFNPSYYGQFQDQECPAGSQWYTCAATTPPFMGCCKSNPCSGGGCPLGDVTAGFLSSNPKVAADFAGANGYSAAPGRSPSTAASSPSSTSTSPSSSALVSNASAVSSSTATTTPTSPSTLTTPAPQPSTTSAGTIAGVVVGGITALVHLIAILAFCLRRNASKSRAHIAAKCGSSSTWDQKNAVESTASGAMSEVPDPRKHESKLKR